MEKSARTGNGRPEIPEKIGSIPVARDARSGSRSIIDHRTPLESKILTKKLNVTEPERDPITNTSPTMTTTTTSTVKITKTTKTTLPTESSTFKRQPGKI